MTTIQRTLWLAVTLVAVVFLCIGSCSMGGQVDPDSSKRGAGSGSIIGDVEEGSGATTATGAGIHVLPSGISITTGRGTITVNGQGVAVDTTVYGSGAATTEDRHIAGPIRSVVVGSTVHVIVVPGEATSVSVTAPADCLPRLQTGLQGDTLVIGLMSGTYEGAITATVTTPSLSGLHLSGDSTADVRGFSGDSCEIALDGASDATVRGAAQAAHVVLNGASGADLTGLAAARWDVTCDGGSTCELSGTADDAQVSAEGASTIDARGFHPHHAHVQADGASTIHLGHVDQLRQDASGASTITTESP